MEKNSLFTAKKDEAAILEKQKADEAADKKDAAAKVAAVKEADKAAIKDAAENELQAKQVYEEEAHDNPFDNIFRAQITEVRKNKDEKVFVQFVVFRVDNFDIKEPIASLPENEFRARFVKLVP